MITPPYEHIHIEVEVSAGEPQILTVSEPGFHGAIVSGIHGIGVNTPIAAAVAAATVGFAGELHIPKGTIFFIGVLSPIVAAGSLLAKTLVTGKTSMDEGATPKVHVSMALITTC